MDYTIVDAMEHDIICECSVKHIPKPILLAKIEVDGKEVYLCPSGLFNLQDLLGKYHLTGGSPSGSVTKHYGKYLRDMAATMNNNNY